MNQRTLLGCLVVLTAVPAFAAEQKPAGETKLDEMVVTATRTASSIADAPGSVSIVSADEIKKRNITSVDQALTLVPGLFTTRNKGPMATTSAVTLRGLPGQSRSLIMLDGMPINDSYSSGVQYGGLYADDLARIEVVRGPSSSLYGSSAMGGVVNMLSVMPDKREFRLSGGYGSSFDNGASLDNLWSTFASYGDKFRNTRVYLSFGYKSTDGYPTGLVTSTTAPTLASGITGATQTTTAKGANTYIIGDSGDNGWWDYSVALRVQQDISSSTNLRFSYLRQSQKYSYGSPHSYLTNASGTPVYTYTNGSGTTVVRENSFLNGDGGKTSDIYTLSAETEVGGVKGKLLFGINDGGDDWYTTPTTGATGATLAGGPGKISSTTRRTYFSDLQLSSPVMEKHLLTGGITIKYDHADNYEKSLSNWKDPDSQTGSPTSWAGGVSATYSAYLQAEIALMNNLTLFTGVRDDYWESFDGYSGQSTAPASSTTNPKKSQNAVSPRGALVWKPADGTILRVSGGKAFNAPNIYQQNRTWSSGTTIYYNNTDLDPETVLSWDIGAEQKLWKGAKAKATYFENHISNMIYYVTTGTTTIGGTSYTTKKYSNAVKGAESRGVELEFEQRFGKELRLFAGYTYTDSRITDYQAPAFASNTNLTGKQLTQVPRHMINAGIDASYGPASLFLSGRYVSKRYNSDDNSDTRNNVYGSYDPYFVMDMKTSYKLCDYATVSLSIDNLLGREYMSYYRAPGRAWFAKLDLKF